MKVTSISGSFNRVAADKSLRYLTGDEGMVVLNIDNQEELSFASISGIRDLCVGDSKVFLATNSGVLYFNRKYDWDYGDFSDEIYYHYVYPQISSNDVTCIDCLGDFQILIGTTSGIDFIEEDNIFNSTEFQNVRAVKISPSGALYYGGEFGLACKRTTITGTWIADYVLNDSTIPPVYEVNDIDITVDGSKRVLGLATEQGIQLIREENIVGNSSIIQLNIQ